MCLPNIQAYKVEREWEHAGLKCAVVQGREAQFRCGYVRVPPTHPAYGKSYDDIDVDVHGGLTFAEQEPCIGHQDGQGFWFGFDCAHAGDMDMDPTVKREDLSQSMQRLYDIHHDFPIRGEHYWLQSEVEAETERLAEQLAQIK